MNTELLFTNTMEHCQTSYNDRDSESRRLTNQNQNRLCGASRLMSSEPAFCTEICTLNVYDDDSFHLAPPVEDVHQLHVTLELETVEVEVTTSGDISPTLLKHTPTNVPSNNEPSSIHSVSFPLEEEAPSSDESVFSDFPFPVFSSGDGDYQINCKTFKKTAEDERWEELNHQLAVVREQLKASQDKLVQLTQPVQFKEGKDVSATAIEEYIRRIRELEEKIAILEAKNAEVRENNAKLDAESCMNKETTRHVKWSTENGDLQKTHSELKKRHCLLETKVGDLTRHNRKLVVQNKELQTKLSDLEAQNKELEAAKVNLQTRNGEMYMKSKKLMKMKHAELHKKMHALKKINADLAANNDKFEKRVAELASKNCELLRKNHELEVTVENVTAYVPRLMKKVEKRQKEIDALKEQVEKQERGSRLLRDGYYVLLRLLNHPNVTAILKKNGVVSPIPLVEEDTANASDFLEWDENRVAQIVDGQVSLVLTLMKDLCHDDTKQHHAFEDTLEKKDEQEAASCTTAVNSEPQMEKNWLVQIMQMEERLTREVDRRVQLELQVASLETQLKRYQSVLEKGKVSEGSNVECQMPVTVQTMQEDDEVQDMTSAELETMLATSFSDIQWTETMNLLRNSQIVDHAQADSACNTRPDGVLASLFLWPPKL